MDERTVFDLSPQMSRASQDLFTPRRLILLVALLVSMFAATAFVH
jgi:hypothetical protein